MKTIFKKNGGFTLVELIVVIAILAILAAVAIPAYSGYIEKANRAGDEQLLAAVNKAFASACSINGDDVYLVENVKDIILKDGKIPENAVSPYKDSFWDLFGDNKDSAFKVFTKLKFKDGRFVDVDALSLAFGDGSVVIEDEQIAVLLGSTFYGEGMTSEKLLNQIHSVAGVAGGIGQFDALKGGPDFVNSCLLSMGITPSDDHAANIATLNAECERLARESLGPNASSNDIYNKTQEIADNALVIYTAQKSEGMTVTQAKDILNNIKTSDIVANVTTGTSAQQSTGVNQAALVYGMYYAYVNSNACTDTNIKGKDTITVMDVTSALDTNTEFKNYINSEQGEKDMEAYLAALGIVSSSASDPDAVEKLAKEGFKSEDLNKLLTEAMGK